MVSGLELAMKFRKKPIVVEATRWFKNGDHPEDNCAVSTDSDGKPRKHEGAVVRYWRAPVVQGAESYSTLCCNHCGNAFMAHGWIDTLEGGHIVCPGDWVITGIAGERYPCKNDIFVATYEPVE